MYTAIKMAFKAPLHIGYSRNDFEDASQRSISSDKLKSAIFACALQLYRSTWRTEEEKMRFFDSFRVSSAFPYMESKASETSYFLPIPTIPQIFKGEDNKQLRKVQYVSKKLFEKLLEGKKLDPKGVRLTKDDILAGEEEEVTDSSLPKDPQKKRVLRRFIYKQLHQHVHIPHAVFGEDSEPYFTETLEFGERAGLYFLCELPKDDNAKKQILASIRLLGDNGLGLNTHTGMGHFEVKDIIENFSINHPKESATNQIALSMYCPLEEEVKDLKKSAYKLIKRGGWVASREHEGSRNDLRRKSIYLFSEGSVFPYMQNRQGKIVDLTPSIEHIKAITSVKHPVYRDGKGIFIPCNIKLE